MVHAGSGAKSSCCGSLQDSLFFCTATLPYVLVSVCWTWASAVQVAGAYAARFK